MEKADGQMDGDFVLCVCCGSFMDLKFPFLSEIVIIVTGVSRF